MVSINRIRRIGIGGERIHWRIEERQSIPANLDSSWRLSEESSSIMQQQGTPIKSNQLATPINSSEEFAYFQVRKKMNKQCDTAPISITDLSSATGSDFQV